MAIGVGLFSDRYSKGLDAYLGKVEREPLQFIEKVLKKRTTFLAAEVSEEVLPEEIFEVEF